MTKVSRFALALAFLVPLGACSNSPSESELDPDPEAADVVAVMGQTFSLRAGQTARVEGAGLVVGFRAVTSDSRCPTDVTCVWAGDAVMRVPVSIGGQAFTPFDLHSSLEPTSVSVGGHTLTFVSLTPAPRADQRIAADRYTLTLRVE